MTFLIFLKNGQIMDIKTNIDLIKEYRKYSDDFKEMMNIDIVDDHDGKSKRFKLSKEIHPVFFGENYCVDFREVLGLREINKNLETKIEMKENERGGVACINSGEEKMFHSFRNDEEIHEFLKGFSDESLTGALKR